MYINLSIYYVCIFISYITHEEPENFDCLLDATIWTAKFTSSKAENLKS